MISSSNEPVYLRALEMSDLAQMLKWHDDPKLYESLVAPFRPTSFTVEGRLRNHVLKNGSYQDVLIMGINNHEFGKK